MIQLTSHQHADTVDLGRRLAALTQPGDVLGLDGQLGAGKTQLVRGLALGLGLDPAQVSSPTFVIMHEYEADHAPTLLLHLDAYRLAGPDELETIGFDDELRRQAVSAIEWASIIRPALGPDRLDIEISHVGETDRLIELTPHGSWIPRLANWTAPAPTTTTPRPTP